MNMHYDRSQGKVPRRQALIAGLLVMALAGPSLAQSRPIAKVWKDPSCGCCKDWVSHLQGAGFDVQVLDTGNTAARTRLGIPQKYGSCHTAQIGGYAIEGHVPASDIQRLLREARRPSASRRPACRSVRPAWMVRPMVDARTPTTCCWLGKTVAARSISRIADHPSTLLRGDMPCSISTHRPQRSPPVLAIALRRGVPHHRRCRRVFPAQGAHGTCCRLSPLPAAGGLSADAPVHAPWSQPRRTRSCRASG